MRPIKKPIPPQLRPKTSKAAGSPPEAPQSDDKTPEERAALSEHCDGLREQYGAVEKHRKQDVQELPRWVKIALTQYETEDITLREAAERQGRASSTLEKYASSPAGKKWRSSVAEIADNPEKLTEYAIRSTVMGVALDNLLAMQMALDAGDFKEYGIMARDWLDRAGITKKPSGASGGPQVLVIKMGQDASLEAPIVESSYEIVQDAVLLDDDDPDSYLIESSSSPAE